MDQKELIELQISEVDMLQSMFPSDGEFSVDDPSVISEARSSLVSVSDSARLSNATFRQITFSVKIKIDEPEVEYFLYRIYIMFTDKVTSSLVSCCDRMSFQPGADQVTKSR